MCFRYQADRWLIWNFSHGITKFDLDIITDDGPQIGKTLFRKEVDLQINQSVCMSSEFLKYLSASCI